MPDMNPKVRQIMLHVERVLLNHIGPCFVPEARITLLVRIPGNDAANVMLTTDTMEEAVPALVRQFGVKDAQDAVRLTCNGLLCSVCRLPQFNTPGGPTCENGHGGAEGVQRDPLFQPCCANEKRSMNGGCLSCGDPCL